MFKSHSKSEYQPGAAWGGGSSDAATVLIALNRLWKTGLTRTELMALGLSLGADVPVFIFGQSAAAEGIGEQLTAISLPEAGYLLAQPDASVPTPEVFRDPGLTRDTNYIKIVGLVSPQDFRGGIETLGGIESPEGIETPVASPANLERPAYFKSPAYKNDLESVAFKLYPEVGVARDWLQNQLLRRGDDVEVRMSGSGACLFAEYNDVGLALLAVQEIIATMRVSDRLYIARDEAHRSEECGSSGGSNSGNSESESHESGSNECRSKMQVRFRLLQASTGLTEHPLRHWIAD